MNPCQGGTALASRALIISNITKTHIYLILYSKMENKHLPSNIDLASGSNASLLAINLQRPMTAVQRVLPFNVGEHTHAVWYQTVIGRASGV